MTKTLHLKKFQDGRISPQEYHKKHGYPPTAKCEMCGARPDMRAIVMMELAEARKNPVIDAKMLMDPVAFMSTCVQIKGSDGKASPYVRATIVYACNLHKKDLEKQAAKAPSHCIVEFNYGVKPDKIQVGYGS